MAPWRPLLPVPNQEAKLAEDPFAIEPKDKFRGFKHEDLLRVDEQTQEALWSRKLGDPKLLFVGVAGTSLLFTSI